jgi:hypothetical protein
MKIGITSFLKLTRSDLAAGAVVGAAKALALKLRMAHVIQSAARDLGVERRARARDPSLRSG